MQNKDLLKGTTSTLVLKIISINDCYGYDIIKQVKTISKDVFNLKQGTLYPILHSLEKDKLIKSYWSEPEGQRKRKYYQITKKGTKSLNEKLKEWELFKSSVDELLVVSKQILVRGLI